MENLVLPLSVTIANSSTITKTFIPYKENFVTAVNAGDAVTFGIKDSREGLYYKGQATSGLLVGVTDSNEIATAGIYNVGTGAFTEGNTYTIIKDGDNSTVIGIIPYIENPGLGLASGNIFTVKIVNSKITSKSDLPSGTIVKVTNTTVAGGYNEYNKSAFEDDGSLITLLNVKKGSQIEIMIKWDTEFINYKFDIQADMQTV